MAHALNGNDLTRRTARAVDLATQYFAYIAGVSVAVAVAAMALVYSAHTALTVVDAAWFQALSAVESRPALRSLPAEQDKAPATSPTFAMLPSSMPLGAKTNLASSNF